MYINSYSTIIVVLYMFYSRYVRGVRDRVVNDAFFEPLVPGRCGLASRQGLWALSCEEFIQLVKGIVIVLLRFPLVSKIMQGGAPEVSLYQ